MMQSRLGLALGGGAARGYAHMGVLQQLDANRIPVYRVTGTSMGAVIGGLYCWFGTARETIDHFKRFLTRSDAVNQAVYRRIMDSEKRPANLLDNLTTFINKGILYGKAMANQSVVPAEVVLEAFRMLVPDVDIRDTRIPFGAVVTDLVEGEELLITGGSLRMALMASSAIPGVYPPVEWNDRILVDGGSSNKIPVRPCYQMGAAQVLAVCVSRELEDTRDFKRGMEIVVRSNAVSFHRLGQLQRQEASLTLHPELNHIHWADFSQIEPALHAGARSADMNMNRIRKLVRRSRWKGWQISKRHTPIREITI